VLLLFLQLTGTVSHVLGRATFDSSYQEEREQNLEGCQTSGDHLKAGLMGLSSGMFGGITSIVTQPINDTRNYGFSVSAAMLGLEFRVEASLIFWRVQSSVWKQI